MGLIRKVLVPSMVLVALAGAPVASAAPPTAEPVASRLVTGLHGSVGSTIGPDGALYIAEGAVGRVTRVDPSTGATTTVVSGLPRKVLGNGGAMDVAFLDGTAYVLVTLVDPGVGGSSVDGIYRVDGPSSFTVIADIGQFARANPPKNTVFSVATGVQYALQPYRGGFLVTDGHHNRVYQVTVDGTVREQIAFGNTVPTGLELRGGTVYMAEAGPVPHVPATGRILSFRPPSTTATELAGGASLLVDVEFGPGNTLFALSQGIFGGGPPGSPASPNTGTLVKVNPDRTFTAVIDGLDRPSSLELIGNAAYVITLPGEVWKVTNV